MLSLELKALNPKGLKSGSKTFDRATHAVMKRVSSSYACQCKAYKNKLSDLKAISGSTEEKILDKKSQRPKKGF